MTAGGRQPSRAEGRNCRRFSLKTAGSGDKLPSSRGQCGRLLGVKDVKARGRGQSNIVFDRDP